MIYHENRKASYEKKIYLAFSIYFSHKKIFLGLCYDFGRIILYFHVMCIKADAINVRSWSNSFICRESTKVLARVYFCFTIFTRAIFQFRRNLSTDIDLVKFPQETEAHYIYRRPRVIHLFCWQTALAAWRKLNFSFRNQFSARFAPRNIFDARLWSERY